MDASEFARLISPHSGDLHFGLCGRDQIVAKLREIADRMERDEPPRIVLQEAHTATSAKHDDYMYTVLVLSFAELSAAAQPGTELRGNAANLPVEVA